MSLHAVFISFLVLTGTLAAKPRIYAYRGYNDLRKTEMEIVGTVSARGHEMGESASLLGYDTRTMSITANVADTSDLRIGDRLYVIEKDPDHRKYRNGYIVGEAEIYSIFRTQFQGYMIKAQGNLSMVKSGHFLARINLSADRQAAMELAGRADRELDLDRRPDAYVKLKTSLATDPERPETWFQLAVLSEAANRPGEAHMQLKEAWKRSDRFHDVNKLLELPGMYMRYEIARIDTEARTPESLLAQNLHLLGELYVFQNRFEWYRHRLTADRAEFFSKRGLPVQEYQLNLGILYSRIYENLSGVPVSRVVAALDKKSRSTLYTEISLPFHAEKKAIPSKEWDEAYLKAAMYHLQLAHELDALNKEAAYRIVNLAWTRLQGNPVRQVQEAYLALLRHYGQDFLSVPSSAARMARIRNILNATDQL